MDEATLTQAVALAVTSTSLCFAAAAHRALFAGRAPPRTARAAAALFVVAGAFATALSHVGALRGVAVVIFPLGLLFGGAAAIASLASREVRAAFDRARDGDLRMLIGTRAAFGAMLLGFAALGRLPTSFALAAGVGDIVVGCLAIGAPGSLAIGGSRWARAIVHGVGLADMIQVIFLAVTVGRPWVLSHEESAIPATLPWLAVPLMITIDLHGLRKVLFARVSEPGRDGSEPLGDVRSPLPRA
jgi:hypothetical protein